MEPEEDARGRDAEGGRIAEGSPSQTTEGEPGSRPPQGRQYQGDAGVSEQGQQQIPRPHKGRQTDRDSTHCSEEEAAMQRPTPVVGYLHPDTPSPNEP